MIPSRTPPKQSTTAKGHDWRFRSLIPTKFLDGADVDGTIVKVIGKSGHVFLDESAVHGDRITSDRTNTLVSMFADKVQHRLFRFLHRNFAFLNRAPQAILQRLRNAPISSSRHL